MNNSTTGRINKKHRNMADEKDSLNEFADKVKQQLTSYADVKIELFKAQWVEKSAVITGKMVTGLIILFVLFFSILFGSLVLGYYLSETMNSTVKGFGFVALLYVALLLIVLLFRKKLIQQPLSNIIIETIYQDEDED